MILLLIISQFNLADQLYQQGYFKEAELEYKRALFYCGQSESADYFRRWLSLCYFHNGEVGRAIETVKDLIIDDRLMKERNTLLLSRLYIKSGYNSLANLELRNLIAQSRDSSTALEARRLSAINEIYREDYLTAERQFTDLNDTLTARRVKRYANQPKKSVFKAVLFSSLLPGSGDLYAGNRRLALIDFTLNAGTAFLLYNALHKKKTFDAVLIISFLVTRFYMGARNNAMNSAIEFNEKQQVRLFEQVEEDFGRDLELY